VTAGFYRVTNLDSFQKAKVLVVGDVMLDRYWWGSVGRISPEAPVPVIRHEKTTAAPGGAANVALNVAALGAKAYLIGSVGNDGDASELCRTLEENGVSASNLIRTQSKRTTVKTRIIAHSQQVARVDIEDTAEIDETDAEAVCEAISSVVDDVDVVIVSDYAKGLLSGKVLTHITQSCDGSGKKLFVDPKGKDFSKYRGATVLTPNRREAAEACKLDESVSEMVSKAGEILIRDFDFQNVLITQGENGMTLFGDGDAFHIDAAAHQVFDVTGAGDTVIATLGVATAAGLEIRSAVHLANLAAGISVGKVGATSVTIEMLRAVKASSKYERQNR
jgi:rfaE bifunctional protein kinase chain/domain